MSPDDIERFMQVGLQASTVALRETLKANSTTPAIPALRLSAVRAPVLVVVATHDPFATFDHAVALSDALPAGAVQVVARCGHSPVWEKPAELARRIAGCLEASDLR